MESIDRQYRQTYLQGKDRDIDVEKEHVGVERGRKGWMGDGDQHTCGKQMASGNLLYSTESFA